MTSEMAQLLPLCETVTPPDEAAVAEIVRRAAEERRPVYPVGGGTRLAYGVLPDAPGIGLDTTGLSGIVDHAADDMTITVEAGTTVARLAGVLAEKRQRLPVDVPRPALATIGGVIATNTFGPRRFGHRTIRDYLIGIRAVDGQGEAFAGGGRVVKNAAGYDMPRLLAGSMGTLGIITRVSLMVRPAPETAALVLARVPDYDTAESLISRLMQSAVRPVSVDWLGSGWEADTSREPGLDGSGRILAGFEGRRVEVEWMVDSLGRDWKDSSARDIRILDEADTFGMWQWMAELPAQLQANVLPSRVGPLIGRMADLDPGCALAAHAGDGVVKIRLSDEAASDLPAVLAGRLRPAVEELEGNLVVLFVQPGTRLTREEVWGPASKAGSLMQAIKERFDPEGILNAGRWVL